MTTAPEVEALYALEKIVDEAADKRWPVSNETVKKAQKKFEVVANMETEVSDSIVNEIQNDLKQLNRMTDGAPRTPIDHMSVQTDMVDKYTSDLIDNTDLL